MIKIKLECWWTDSGSLTQRLINQYVSDEDLQNFKFVSSNPDITIVFGKTEWDNLETPKERNFYFSQEPLWSPNQPKDHIHNYCSKIFISDKEDYPQRSEYIETFLPMFYGGRGETDSRPEWEWSKKLQHRSFDKTKNTSIIVTNNISQHSNQVNNPLTSQINYKQRTELGLELSKNNQIDVYGTFWQSNGSNIKGEVWNKHIGLDDYMFSVACENSIQKNYVSEKFWDVVLTDTVPIYLGCNNITDYIPEDFFISLNGKNLDEMVYIVNEVNKNPNFFYKKFSKNILKLKQDFFQNPNYNLWEKIKKEIKNV